MYFKTLAKSMSISPGTRVAARVPPTSVWQVVQTSPTLHKMRLSWRWPESFCQSQMAQPRRQCPGSDPAPERSRRRVLRGRSSTWGRAGNQSQSSELETNKFLIFRWYNLKNFSIINEQFLSMLNLMEVTRKWVNQSRSGTEIGQLPKTISRKRFVEWLKI